MAKIIDGKAISAEIKEELKEKNGIVKEQISKNGNWKKIKVSAIDAAQNIQQEELRVLVIPTSLQKAKPENNRVNIIIVILFLMGLFVWKKKRGCFILK